MEIESEERKVIGKEARKVLKNENRYSKSDKDVRVGVESEYSIIDEDKTPLDRQTRNSIVEKFDFTRKELGEFTIELVTDRSYLNSLEELKKSINSREEEVTKELDEGLELIRNGVQPFTAPEDVGISRDKGFESCMQHYKLEDERELGARETVHVPGPKATGLICAIHTNVESKSFSDAVKKANYTYMISPYISALSGNSRLIKGEDTGISDLRMILWNKSHSSEEKIGVLETYYSSLEDYLERVVNQEFIPEKSRDDLGSAISNFWKDARIKVIDEDLVVESRIPSIQPTVDEDVAVHGFYLGRLHYAMQNGEELIDIEKVNRNREEALKKGLDAKLYTPQGGKKKATEMLGEEIEKAREGLEYIGVDSSGLLQILEERIEEGKIPSDEKAEFFAEKEGSGREVIYKMLDKVSGEEYER